MKRTWIYTLVAGGAVLGLLTAAWAAPRPHQRRGPEWAGPGMVKVLDLTAEQKEKMEAIRYNQRRKLVQMRADLQVARMDLQQVMKQDAPSKAEVKKKVAEINRLRSAMFEQQVDGRLEQQSVLTPEQRERMRQALENRPHQRGHQRPGRGGPDARGPGWDMDRP